MYAGVLTATLRRGELEGGSRFIEQFTPMS